MNLTASTQTAIGSVILRALDAIAEVDERVAASDEIGSDCSEQPPQGRSSKDGYVPHIIVLLTDGASNTGPPPLAAAQQASARGVRVPPNLMQSLTLHAGEIKVIP